jgi:PLP dependent protein
MSLTEIHARIARAATTAGRDPTEVTLIAVSKEQPADRVEPILRAGQRIFGENRVQEAQGRWPPFIERFGPMGLHLIGPLQTNKARAAVDLFQAIHSVDRLKLVHVLARLADERGASPALFIQVNTGEEAQKAGCPPAEVDDLVRQTRALGLPLQGLMCIPPAAGDPAPHFRTLAGMAGRNGLTGLSMGMSGDFETAIACGATHVRVGAAIFGARAPRPESDG